MVAKKMILRKSFVKEFFETALMSDKARNRFWYNRVYDKQKSIG